MSKLAPPNPRMVQRVADILATAERALFVTGAGISADSGLPTYRGVSGLYNNTDTDEGIPIEFALSGHMFQERPEVTWKHIIQIADAANGAKPNRGHEVIALLEQDLDVFTLTQNVDGLHRAAGSSTVIEIHGDVHYIDCTSCEYTKTVDDYDWIDRESLPPTCPDCESVVRPRVVLFNEMLPGGELKSLREELEQGFDIVFSIGTTSVFPYIAGPVVMASQLGIPSVEINPTPTEVSESVSFRFESGAADTLDAIYAAYLATK